MQQTRSGWRSRKGMTWEAPPHRDRRPPRCDQATSPPARRRAGSPRRSNGTDGAGCGACVRSMHGRGIGEPRSRDARARPGAILTRQRAGSLLGESSEVVADEAVPE